MTTAPTPASAPAGLTPPARLSTRVDVAIQGIRLRLEREPLEWRELARICDELRIPHDFDIAHISWKADYDSFYYNQLSKRTRKMFLFRDEYIFELERAIVVEVPQQGHATYVFSRPANLDQWVRAYARYSGAVITSYIG